MTGESYDTSRRDLLAAMAAAGVAGCSGDGQDTQTPANDGENTPDNNPGNGRDTPQRTQTETYTPEQNTPSNSVSSLTDIVHTVPDADTMQQTGAAEIANVPNRWAAFDVESARDSMSEDYLEQVNENTSQGMPGYGFLDEGDLNDINHIQFIGQALGAAEFDIQGDELQNRFLENQYLDSLKHEGEENGLHVYTFQFDNEVKIGSGEDLNARVKIKWDFDNGYAVWGTDYENDELSEKHEAGIDNLNDTWQGVEEPAIEGEDQEAEMIKYALEGAEGNQYLLLGTPNMGTTGTYVTGKYHDNSETGESVDFYEENGELEGEVIKEFEIDDGSNSLENFMQ
jgi:hypothetical protein